MRSKKPGRKQLRLSPSSINTYFQSPRLFYYKYILKLQTPPSIHLYKGTFVHSAIEKLFMTTHYRPPKVYFQNYLKRYNVPHAILKRMTEEEIKHHRYETEKILENFADYFDRKIEMVMLEGKAKGINHAWNLIKPRLREHKIFDKKRNVVGIIDAIEENIFDKISYIIDYKTSKLYKHTVPKDYIRQISIYAYLFERQFGKLPDFAGVHYLRYGEVFLVPITEEIVQQAKDDIDLIREKCKSRNIEDYPIGDNTWGIRDCEYFEKKLAGKRNERETES